MDIEHRLLGALFENLDGGDWATCFLQGVCASTRSHAAAVLSVDTTTRRQALPAFVGAGQESALAFEQTHSTGNPWRPSDETRGPPAGAVVVPDDAMPLTALRKTAFWREFLRPMDVDHAAGLIGLRLPHRVVSMTLLRSQRQGVYGAAERALLGRLAPHWTNACRLRERWAPIERQGLGTDRALDAIGTPTFLLDERGRCVRWNAAGEALLRNGTLVRLRAGRLLASADGGRLFRSFGTCPVVLRQRDGTAGGHAALHSLPGHGAFGHARAVLFVEPIRALSHRSLQDTLSVLYGLTPREGEVACRLAEGATLSEVAEAMNITAGAARTRLKVVFGKTQVRHQAALVALVRSLKTVLA